MWLCLPSSLSAGNFSLGVSHDLALLVLNISVLNTSVNFVDVARFLRDSVIALCLVSRFRWVGGGQCAIWA